MFMNHSIQQKDTHTQKKSVNSLNDALKQLVVNMVYDDFGCSGSRAGEEISPTNVASASSNVRSRDEPRNRVDSSSSLILSRTFAPLTYSLQRHLEYAGIYPLTLCQCKIWSHNLRQEQRLRVPENKFPMRIFTSKREELRNGENYTVRSFTICTLHLVG